VKSIRVPIPESFYIRARLLSRSDTSSPANPQNAAASMVLKISSVQISFPGFAIKGPDMQTAALAEKTLHLHYIKRWLKRTSKTPVCLITLVQISFHGAVNLT
jgi:hypothetical protein